MIEIRNVIKNFGSRQVLKGISFRVEDGQIAGLLGSNGAGKSTTMNILAGCLSSTEGEVSIQGFDTLTQPVKSRGQIGYLPETPPLYDDMTVEEYLDFAGRLKGIKDREERKSTLTEVMAKTGVSQVAGRLIGNLSKGYRQRLGLAQALMGSPPVLILDEPMAGLDPEQTVEMRNLIQGLGGEHTIIVSSHFLSDLQAICDKMIIMVDGRIAFDDTADRLVRQYTEEGQYRLTVKARPEALTRLLNEADFVEGFQLDQKKEESEKETPVSTEKTEAEPDEETAESEKKETSIPKDKAEEKKAESEKKETPIPKDKSEEEKAEPEEKASASTEKTEAEPEEEMTEPQKKKAANKKKKKKRKGAQDEEQLPSDPGDVSFAVKLKQESQSLDQLFYLLARRKMPILHMESVELSLEDIFVRVIREYKENTGEEGQE